MKLTPLADRVVLKMTEAKGPQGRPQAVASHRKQARRT